MNTCREPRYTCVHTQGPTYDLTIACIRWHAYGGMHTIACIQQNLNIYLKYHCMPKIETAHDESWTKLLMRLKWQDWGHSNKHITSIRNFATVKMFNIKAIMFAGCQRLEQDENLILR